MPANVLLWSAALLFPAPLVIALNLQLDDAPAVRLYISLGLVAYCWWLLAILLGVRPGWLDRHVGLPSIYRMHGVLGIVAVLAAYVHRENTFAAMPWPRLLGEWAFWLALAVLAYAIVFLSGWLVDRSAVLGRIKRRAERFLPHQLSVWLHRLNLVAVALVWLHVHVIDRVAEQLAFMIMFDLYTVVTLGTYAWRRWVAPDSFLTGTVSQSTALNDSTRRITVALDRPSRTARPGDFYFLSFEGETVSAEPHPFSATDDRTDALTFTIRNTGDFTGGLHQVRVGSRVRLEGPFGRFQTRLDESGDRPLVLIGMGAGIAPLLSLVAAHHEDRRIRLMWSVRRPDDAYYRDALDDYEHRAGGRLTVKAQVGRFRHDQLTDALTTDEIASGHFFVVGPNPAVLAQQRLLRRLGVARRRIHHERLTM